MIVGLILGSGMRAAAQGRSSRSYTERTAENVIYESKVAQNVEYFCDSLLQGRAFGTVSAFYTAYDIVNRFKNFGFLPLIYGPSESISDYSVTRTYSQGFEAEGGKGVGHNVVGMLPGSAKQEINSYIIVASHFDGIGMVGGKMYPGADSDISGLVAMLSVAEMFSTMKTLGRGYYSNIIFVAFDGKRMSMAGSEAFYKAIERGELRNPLTGKVISRAQIKAMINIDQIGATLEPLHAGVEDYIIALGNETLPSYRRDAIGACNRSYGLGRDVGYDYYGSENFTRLFYTLSDQRPFAAHSVPALFFTSGITRTTNKFTDTPETLNYPVLIKRIYLIYYLVNRLTY